MTARSGNARMGDRKVNTIFRCIARRVCRILAWLGITKRERAKSAVAKRIPRGGVAAPWSRVKSG